MGSIFMLSSCNKEDEFSGTPVITQVRLLNPAKKDSTFKSANPGTQILIEGQNLGGATQVYFNDFPASFNAVYNTNNNLIVTIPSKAPTEATNPNIPNKIRFVTLHGETAYDFVLNIPPPAIYYIRNENALPGDSLIIVGANLWLIEKITLPGNNDVATFSTNKDGSVLGFIMPDLGTESGAITIQAKYGTVSGGPINLYAGPGVISNLTASWESGEPSILNWGFWGANRKNDATLFPGTRGSYLQSVFGGIGANDGAWWDKTRYGNFTDAVVIDPADLNKAASDYAVKFEVNTKEPWKTAICVLRFQDGVYAYRLRPFENAVDKTFDTKNTWQTITVPLSEFRKKGNNPQNKEDEGYGVPATTVGDLLSAAGKAAFTYRIMSEDQPITIFNAAFDNIRIVKIPK